MDVKCDECHEEKPIVITCMIGCRLCAECQEKQQRISDDELLAYYASETYWD